MKWLFEIDEIVKKKVRGLKNNSIYEMNIGMMDVSGFQE